MKATAKFNPTTKFELSTALFTHAELRLITQGGAVHMMNVQSIEAEAGGKQTWNVTGYICGNLVTCFVRTID